eukprot:1985604-Amphidinium_carterae.1
MQPQDKIKYESKIPTPPRHSTGPSAFKHESDPEIGPKCSLDQGRLRNHLRQSFKPLCSISILQDPKKHIKNSNMN